MHTAQLRTGQLRTGQLRTRQLRTRQLRGHRPGDHPRRVRRQGDRGRGAGSSAGGPQQDEESVAAIHRALELGINWIDTAAAYGFGRSERVVAAALAGLTERPYVFTKASLLDDGTGRVRHSLQRDSVLREAEQSLERGVTPGAVAVAWTLCNLAVAGAITGFRRPAQVDPIAAAADLDLTDQDISQIDAGTRGGRR